MSAGPPLSSRNVTVAFDVTFSVPFTMTNSTFPFSTLKNALNKLFKKKTYGLTVVNLSVKPRSFQKGVLLIKPNVLVVRIKPVLKFPMNTADSTILARVRRAVNAIKYPGFSKNLRNRGIHVKKLTQPSLVTHLKLRSFGYMVQLALP